MLDRDIRAAVLTLAKQGRGVRAIARAAGISRNSVKKVLESGEAEVPPLARSERLDPHLALVRELHASCKGNLVRVHEELLAEGVGVGYPTLTSFCRRNGIGRKLKVAAGEYSFAPGEEMQHDTSPHDVEVGGRLRRLQCASLILCYSRRQYAQVYPRWMRFEARVFLSEALQYLGGAAGRCMLDNSTVIMIGGTGKDAVPAPALAALSDRFVFDFVAHEVGDADRSGRVERPFHHIENNFYAGRTFADLADLNEQLRAWCGRNNQRHRKRLGASPMDLYAVELPALNPLPAYVPEVYALHRRRVDIEGYVNLHTNRYSVAAEHIGKHLEAREGIDRVRLFDGHRLVAEHVKEEYGARLRRMLPEHRGQRRGRQPVRARGPEEVLLRGQAPEFTALVDALQKRYGGRAVKAVRRLHKLWTDYPTEALRGAVSVALAHGLIDLGRIERMVLRRIAGDFFRLPTDDEDDDG